MIYNFDWSNVRKYFDRKSLIYYLVIAVIIVTSFFLFSSAYYPLVSSDMAINILIADSFSLPHDFYCWGQDRGGMLIPMIGSFMIRTLSITPIIAVSIANYLILTVGFIGYSKIFNHRITAVLFAIIWFFPYQRFIDLTSFPIGAGYSLIGFSLLFLLKIDLTNSLLKNRKNLFNVVATISIWLCAVWVSDLVYITLLILGIVGAFYFFLNKNKITYSIKPILYTYLIGMVLIVLIIKKLKTYVTGVTQNFSNFNTLDELRTAIRIVYTKCSEVLLFQESFFISLGAWIILAFLLIGIYLIVRRLKYLLTFQNFWLNFFLADFIGMILVLFLSNWVLMNDMGRWYFVAPYISCSIFLLIAFDRFSIVKSKLNLIGLFTGLLLLGISPVISIYSRYGEYRSMASYIRELNRYGEIGVIGDFWEAYRMAMVNPKQIKSTSHDYSNVKNPSRVIETLLQPRLFVSRDMWMDSFPDTLNQFGHVLIKKGAPLFLGGSNICEYQLQSAPEHFVLQSTDLFLQGGVSNEENHSVSFSSSQKRTGYSVYGPKVTLLKGEYIVDYYINLDNLREEDQIILDVSSNSGQVIHYESSLDKVIFDESKGCYTVKFKTNKSLLYVEFRILEKQPINYTFFKIEVNKTK
jgi:hypothetical protein